MSGISKTKGTEILLWVNRLYQADILSPEDHREYVVLVKKGLKDPEYYTMVVTKLQRSYGNDKTLSEPQKRFLERVMKEITK